MVKIRFVCICLLFLSTLNTFSQSITRSVISVTGNSTLQNSGMLSYTIGEPIAGSLFYEGNALTQGFQQPSLINTLGNNSNLGLNAIEVFPNPVIKDLTMLFNIRTTKILHIELFSGNGTIFRSSQSSVSESGSIVVEMGNFPAGLYLLHVYSADKLIDRVFKIEKM